MAQRAAFANDTDTRQRTATAVESRARVLCDWGSSRLRAFLELR